MRNLTTLVAGAAIILLSVAALPAQTDEQQNKPAFADVPPTHWAYNAVQRLAKAGIIEGYPLNKEQQANSISGSTLTEAGKAASIQEGLAVAGMLTALTVASIKEGLATHTSLRGSSIDVTATPTTVILSGTVQRLGQKVLTEQIARRKAGNLKIVNHLKIVGPAKH